MMKYFKMKENMQLYWVNNHGGYVKWFAEFAVFSEDYSKNALYIPKGMVIFLAL